MNLQSLLLVALKLTLSAGFAKLVGLFYPRAGIPVLFALMAYWLWSSWKYNRLIDRND